jgi:hypothetical protein
MNGTVIRRPQTINARRPEGFFPYRDQDGSAGLTSPPQQEPSALGEARAVAAILVGKAVSRGWTSWDMCYERADQP